MGQTTYQKVKRALAMHGPITYPRLALLMPADQDAVYRALAELRRRGKARCERNRVPEAQLWQSTQL